jgi:hypothetical protein
VPYGATDVETEIAAAFDAVNQTEGGMCAMINTGSVFRKLSFISLVLTPTLSRRFSLKMRAQHDQGRLLHSLVLSVMGQV